MGSPTSSLKVLSIPGRIKGAFCPHILYTHPVLSPLYIDNRLWGALKLAQGQCHIVYWCSLSFSSACTVARPQAQRANNSGIYLTDKGKQSLRPQVASCFTAVIVQCSEVLNEYPEQKGQEGVFQSLTEYLEHVAARDSALGNPTPYSSRGFWLELPRCAETADSIRQATEQLKDPTNGRYLHSSQLRDGPFLGPHLLAPRAYLIWCFSPHLHIPSGSTKQLLTSDLPFSSCNSHRPSEVDKTIAMSVGSPGSETGWDWTCPRP